VTIDFRLWHRVASWRAGSSGNREHSILDQLSALNVGFMERLQRIREHSIGDQVTALNVWFMDPLLLNDALVNAFFSQQNLVTLKLQYYLFLSASFILTLLKVGNFYIHSRNQL